MAYLRSSRGVTLMEMLIVMTLIGLLVGVTFPSVSAGLDSIRLSSATDSLVSAINAGLNRAERRQEVVEVTISKADNSVALRSLNSRFVRQLDLPKGVSIAAVLPKLPTGDDLPRHFLLYPGGAPPRFGVELSNNRGVHRVVRLDPITSVPQVERVEAE